MKLLEGIELRVTNSNGCVDYIAAAEDPSYIKFEEEVCELQGIKLVDMEEGTKLAF